MRVTRESSRQPSKTTSMRERDAISADADSSAKKVLGCRMEASATHHLVTTSQHFASTSSGSSNPQILPVARAIVIDEESHIYGIEY